MLIWKWNQPITETSISETPPVSGGTVVLTTTNPENSAILVLPPDYYTEVLTLIASSHSNNFFITSKPVSLLGVIFVGKTYDYDLFLGSPELTEVSLPIPITLADGGGDLIGVEERSLAPYRWNGTNWEVIPNFTLNTATRKIVFSTISFSSFSVQGVGKVRGGAWKKSPEEESKRSEKAKRSENATEFIDELKEKILETGIVKNTHEPYDPKKNKRYKASEKQAFRVAYSIAKEKGMRVGKYRGPNKR